MSRILAHTLNQLLVISIYTVILMWFMQSGFRAIISQTFRNLSRLSMDQLVNVPIVWADLEMTGLDINKDHILEVSCIITDNQLNVIAEGPDIIIHQPDSILENMNDWCIENHKKTGLTDASRASKISLQEAECQILDFLKKHVRQRECPLAGNSVYMDRLFLRKHMPEVDEYLHYRIIDVSTIKELSKRWSPELYKKAPTKVFEHRSNSDIKESIKELQYYKPFMFKS